MPAITASINKLRINKLRRKSYRSEFFGRYLTMFCAALVILITVSIIVFISTKGLATFLENKVSIKDFLFSSLWLPDRAPAQGGPRFGILAFMTSSVVMSLIAVLISAPVSIIAAFFIAEIAPNWGKRLLQPAIELLAGIPSVIYGWMGLSILVPFIRIHIGGLGLSMLAGALVLAVMIIPTIVSVSVDNIKVLPITLKEAAYALGSTRWQTIYRVLLPAARSGIITGVVLGMSRAFGEALAVQMVIGNKRLMPHSLLDQMTTLTSAITMDMGNTIMGSAWNNALWSMALLLLAMSMFFIIVIRLVSRGGVK